MKIQIAIVMITGLALSLASCGKVSQPMDQHMDVSSYAGVDACKVEDKLDASDPLKRDFVSLFGKTRWTTWTSYSAAHCAPIEKISDPQLGDLLVLSRAELAGSARVADAFATLFIHPNGKIEAICYSDEDPDYPVPPNTMWLGHGFIRGIRDQQCDDQPNSDKIYYLKAAENLPGYADPLKDVRALIGRNPSDLRDQLNHSVRLKRQVIELYAAEDDKGHKAWNQWTSFFFTDTPITYVTDSDLGRVIVLQALEGHEAYGAGTGSAAIILKQDGNIIGFCLTDDGDTADWRIPGRNGQVPGNCSGSPEEIVKVIVQAQRAAR